MYDMFGQVWIDLARVGKVWKGFEMFGKALKCLVRF
jgi:hypothetical protein